MPETGARGAQPQVNPWIVAIAVMFGTFMEVLDTTVVNVSLPHIAGSLSASADEATWALTSYLVANGIVLTISGWLGDLLGRKRYFLICIGMFTVCSFLCGIAGSLSQLIIFRLAQGSLQRRDQVRKVAFENVVGCAADQAAYRSLFANLSGN